MTKFKIDVMEVNTDSKSKSVVRLFFGNCGGKISVAHLYSAETVGQVLQSKEYYQRQLIKQIADNVSWEETNEL